MPRFFPPTPRDLPPSFWPQCAKCNKPVKSMAMTNDPITHHKVFTVWCHGESETIRISHEDLCDGIILKAGWAFKEVDPSKPRMIT